MPELTPNLGLKKPSGNNYVKRAAYNENLDLIDQNAAPVVHGHDVVAPDADGFMAVSDKIKLDKIQSVIVTKSDIGSDDDYIDLSDLGLTDTPHVITSPADLHTYDPSQSAVGQKIKCWADNITASGFIGHAQLVSIGQTTKHAESTVLNDPGSVWESGVASSQNTTEIKVRVVLRKNYQVFAQRSKSVTQKYQIHYRLLGETNWTLFKEFAHTHSHYNGSFVGAISYQDVSHAFIHTLPLNPAQYEIKIIYVSEVGSSGGGDAYFNNCYLTVNWWEETSDVVLQTGKFNYLVVGERALQEEGS